MSQVLAPHLKLFGRPADLLAEFDKGISEAVWIELGQSGTFKGFSKDPPNGRGGTPVLPPQSQRFKLVRSPKADARRRE